MLIRNLPLEDTQIPSSKCGEEVQQNGILHSEKNAIQDKEQTKNGFKLSKWEGLPLKDLMNVLYCSKEQGQRRLYKWTVDSPYTRMQLWPTDLWQPFQETKGQIPEQWPKMVKTWSPAANLPMFCFYV